MRMRPILSRFEKTRKGLMFALGLLTAAVSAAGRAKSEDIGIYWIAASISWTQDWGWLCIFASGLTTAGLNLVPATSRWVEDEVTRVLNEIRDEMFGHLEAPNHHHRVTLFRRCKWKFWVWGVRSWFFWPWGFGRYPGSGWLVSVARSGHATQRDTVSFLAPDDADEAEGVAGQAWSRNSRIPVNNLPDVDENAPQEMLESYSKQSWISVDWVRRQRDRRKPIPRSLIGMPVQVSGKLWGVLVVDSREESLPKIDAPGGLRNKLNAKLDTLSTLLKGA